MIRCTAETLPRDKYPLNTIDTRIATIVFLCELLSVVSYIFCIFSLHGRPSFLVCNNDFAFAKT